VTPAEQARRILEALQCGQRCPCESAFRRGFGATHCPAHDDAKPSLSVGVKNNLVLVHCQARSCDQHTAIAALHERGLWPDVSRNGHVTPPPIIYPYPDENGTLLFQVVREPGHRFRMIVERGPMTTAQLVAETGKNLRIVERAARKAGLVASWQAP
jgi:hypothetical protein